MGLEVEAGVAVATGARTSSSRHAESHLKNTADGGVTCAMLEKADKGY